MPSTLTSAQEIGSVHMCGVFCQVFVAQRSIKMKAMIPVGKDPQSVLFLIGEHEENKT